MSTRRDFLYGAAALAGLASLPASAGGLDPAQSTAQIDAVLFDARYSDSRAFAQALARRGARTFAVQEDIGRLWYGPLGQLQRERRASIAGLTLHSDLFVSREFARGYRSALLHEGVHDCRGCARLTHTIERGRALRRPERLGAHGWAESLADELAGALQAERLSSPLRVQGARRAADHPGVLYSWLLG